MKSIKKIRLNKYVDMAINANEIAAWAAKNGFTWKMLAYWKDGKEYEASHIYDLYTQSLNK